jgi:hypothetical protein
MNDVRTDDLPTSERDRLREIIRAEVAKANPIDDARRPVELIVETSVRLSGKDGKTVEVIDEKGNLRTGVTVQDVLEELRAKHPTLFKPAQEPSAPADPAVAAETARPGVSVADAPEAAEVEAPPPRDWLIIGEGPRSPRYVEDSDRRASLGELAQERRETLGRLTQDLRSRFGSAAGSLTNGLQTARGSVVHSLEDVQHEIFRDPSPRLKVRHVLGAVGGVLALALVAYFVYAIASLPFGSGLADPSRTAEAPATEPVETGTVSAGSTATANTTPVAQTASLRGVPEVLDTATLWLQGKIVHLYGVEWVRGGGDPEEFTRYLRGREVACDPSRTWTPIAAPSPARTSPRLCCSTAAAGPRRMRHRTFAPPREKAKTAKLGVWNK